MAVVKMTPEVRTPLCTTITAVTTSARDSNKPIQVTLATHQHNGIDLIRAQDLLQGVPGTSVKPRLGEHNIRAQRLESRVKLSRRRRLGDVTKPARNIGEWYP